LLVTKLQTKVLTLHSLYIYSSFIFTVSFTEHVVVMRKGGFPVAINMGKGESDERIRTEDIHVPPDSKM
jgi:hypothetical protein